MVCNRCGTRIYVWDKIICVNMLILFVAAFFQLASMHVQLAIIDVLFGEDAYSVGQHACSVGQDTCFYCTYTPGFL
jgi:hypothetical protein